MKYLFILGRNPQLSIAEIFAYFQRKKNRILNSQISKNALVIEIEKKLEENTINFLGGTLSIGIVLGSKLKELDDQELYAGTSNKLNYVIWDFSEDEEELRNYLKKRFRSEKLKATEKKLRERLDLQNGEKQEIISSKKIDEEFFIFESNKEKYFGKIIQKCDYSELEKRDMEKPTRRESLAISPRLSKIMINLSEIKEKEKLLDAFCGIGVILEEALLQNLEVVGIELDQKAISGLKENLNWFNFDKKNYSLIKGDSSKEKIPFVDALVSEPDLGEIHRKIPPNEKVKIQLRKFENLMINVLNNLKDKISGKIVFTSPLIKTFSSRKGCNIDLILKKTGLKLVKNFPIDEFRKNQIVGRRIFVLEK